MEFKAIHSSSSANLYTVKSGESSLLIEAGLRGKKLSKALGFKLASMSGALITHSHGDHSKGCRDVIKAGVECYMTQETADKIGVEGYRIKIIEPLKQFKIDNWTVLPFPTQHDCPGSVGFLIQNGVEKLLFITDSYYCKYCFKGLTIVAIECNWSDETLCVDQHSTNYMHHFNLERVLRFLEASDLSAVREIHLLHLSDQNSDESMFKSKIERATGKPVYIARK